MKRKLFRGIVTLLPLLGSPAIVTPYQERVIVSMEAGTCSLRVEADDSSHTLRLRVHPEYPNCHISKEDMLSILRAAFSKTGPLRLGGTYTSLYIGRMIDFPWLSQYLAARAYEDTGWDRKAGKPVSAGINKYVAGLLLEREVTQEIEGAFGESGYRIVSVSVEKVLVGGFRDVPLCERGMTTGKIPYDAQVWFVLEKRSLPLTRSVPGKDEQVLRQAGLSASDPGPYVRWEVSRWGCCDG